MLITAASGFIGKATVKAALQNPNWDVSVVVSGKRPYSFPDKVNVHIADLAKSEQCETLIEKQSRT